MADKEERIMVGKIPNDVCVHQGQRISMEKGLETICYKKSSGVCNKKRCKIKQFVGITKQEAIEIMAKRLIFEGVNYFECHEIAKWCLDALLEGVKK